jgi:diadenosine tetraphosphatase ApaH/serine/threonine PP2A family protein phosphatase
MSRFIAIGDIHGCADEFEALLDRLAPAFGDRVILLGDLVNRGPDSRRVVRIARGLGAVCLLGNHELRLIQARHTRQVRRLEPDYRRTYDQLEPEDFAFLERMPLTHCDRASGLLCVHGGFMPGFPWQVQCAEIVTRIQVVDTDGMPRTRSQCPLGRPWASLWQGPEFVVYGHTPARKVRRHPLAIGIDTACVRGGRLTAYVYPEDRCHQVPARRAYI